MQNGATTHPRPQLTRERWTNLCGTWQFAYDDADAGTNARWWTATTPFDRTIVVPFPPESPASGITDTGFHPIVWYRRAFAVEAEDRGKHLILHFGAVDYRARVWVNGQLVAAHEGGHTPFSADITPALRDDGEQIIVVRAEDDPHDLAQPRGKQDWEREPHRIWYDRTTGIWQPVWLEAVAAVHIADLRWTPDVDHGTLGLTVRLNNAPPCPLVLRVRLALRDETLVDDWYTMTRAETAHTLALDAGLVTQGRDTILWSPTFPNLLDATLTLSAGDDILDTVGSYAGMRSVGIANGRFILNGRPTYLRLALEQGFWPESHLAAPDDDALRREVALAKSLGFNGVRIHQKVEDPRFLYWCDKLGLLVWGEMANTYVFSATAVERLTREWLDVVRRDYSHPCIVLWVPLNESWGVPALARDPQQQAYIQMLYSLTKTLDPTRPVIGNDGWEHVASDVLGIHDYAIDGATITERYGTPEAMRETIARTQPQYRAIVLAAHHDEGASVMLTECGGFSMTQKQGERWYGYGSVHTPEELLARYGELIDAILACPTISGFCYTQLTDTQQEANGLLTAARAPKLDPDAIRAITAAPSKAVPGELFTAIQLTADLTAQATGE